MPSYGIIIGERMNTEQSYGLGLDQGVSSIGWALLRLDAEGEAVGIERLGTHLFEAGTDGTPDKIARGGDTSLAEPRRLARALRRQYFRKCLRKRRLLRWLQSLDLLPPGDVNTAEGRDALIRSVDAVLREKWNPDPATITDPKERHRLAQLLPYRLRAQGLTARLEPYEFGRALYHLAQRRGYLSNRKADGESARDEQGTQDSRPEAAAPEAADSSRGAEDLGTVRAAIVELTRQMQGAGVRTLAEYFCRLDPSGTLGDRLRGRWTARDMFLEEFNRLWDQQRAHHTQLTDEARKNVFKAIFFQRPLKSASSLIGRCELVPGQKRAPIAHRLAQRFRLLCAVNNLLIELPDFSSRKLSPEERAKVLDGLCTQGDITFAKLKQRTWLGLPRGTIFNLERGGTGGEKRLIGHRTDARCRGIFGDERWTGMSDTEKDAVVSDMMLFQKPTALAKRGRLRYGLDADAAAKLGDTTLEAGYAAYSLGAIERLLPRLEAGKPLATAKKEEFPELVSDESEPLDLLPPAIKALGNLRNPTVLRALSELRKLVNAVVRQYGKPRWIRLELARDLKRARKERERVSTEMREREGERERARARILKETGIDRPSRGDIERVLLWEECNGVCPYTGRSIAMTDLIGRTPRFDVEHIWPLSRSLDDSFLNKTLCEVNENRNVKQKRTPFEAYSHDAERWELILDRIRRFKGDARRIKLERFMAEHLPEGFAQRHLAETRKIGSTSAEYLGLLYGRGLAEGVDPSGTRRVFVSPGGLTAHLRREWQLSAVLNGEDVKSRDDHRHHAIDALVVALTTPAAVSMLQRAAERASAVGRRLFAPVEEPWAGFLDEAARAADAINVSYRANRRFSGALHAATNYSRLHPGDPEGTRRLRRELSKLKPSEVENIVDPKIRAIVRAHIDRIGAKPKNGTFDAFADRAKRPFIQHDDGTRTYIHKVRLFVKERPRPIGGKQGKGGVSAARHVGSTSGSNHHTLIEKNSDGKWTDSPVPLLDACRKSGSTRRRPHGSDSLTLASTDFLLLKNDEGVTGLYRVLSISKSDIRCIFHTEGRPVSEDGVRIIRIKSMKALWERAAKKVSVTYLGEIRRAGG